MAAQLATTRAGDLLQKLTPDFKRLNPARSGWPRAGQNLPHVFQALLLLPLVGLVVYYEVTENLDSFLELPWLAPRSCRGASGQRSGDAAVARRGVVSAGGVVDLLWQRHRYTKQLNMTKQEIREESKEQESNPHIKTRIRRLQRDLPRRKMMKEIPTATAVIVNPTHYAVAIRYSRGLERRAESGRQRQELPGAAHPQEGDRAPGSDRGESAAGAGAVQFGRGRAGDPRHLYRAVAEILAYIYKLMNGKLPG